MPNPNSFVGSAKLIAVWTLVSRVTGLVRDIYLNARFGQTWVQDAFNYGFQIPNLFRRLFGEGALSAVFVPTFSDTLHTRGPEAAWTLLARVLARLAAILTIITVLLELIVLAIWLYDPGGPYRRLILSMTAIMLPFMISICLVALFSSILNCLDRFALPAAMPIVLNVCTIVAIAWLSPLAGERLEERIVPVALSVLAAGVIQLALMRPALRRAGVRIGLDWRGGDPDVRAMSAAFVPVVLGQGVLLLNSFLDSQICTLLSRHPEGAAEFQLFGATIAYPMADGALSAVTNAQRLYQFPLGVLAISLATAALPTFSRFAAAGDMAGLRGALQRAMRLAVFEGLPCGMVLCVLSEPIIRLLFQHGRYTAEHAARAADVLRWYGVGVWAFCLQHVVLRGFYSMKDTRTPMRIGVALVGLNLAISLSLLWVPAVREQAFGISTSLTATANVTIGLWLLRSRLGGRVGGRSLGVGLLKTLVCTGAAAGAMLGAAAAIGRGGPGADSLVGRAVQVFGPLGAAVGTYLLCAALLGMEELRWVFGREGRRAGGRRES